MPEAFEYARGPAGLGTGAGQVGVATDESQQRARQDDSPEHPAVDDDGQPKTDHQKERDERRGGIAIGPGVAHHLARGNGHHKGDGGQEEQRPPRFEALQVDHHIPAVDRPARHPGRGEPGDEEQQRPPAGGGTARPLPVGVRDRRERGRLSPRRPGVRQLVEEAPQPGGEHQATSGDAT